MSYADEFEAMLNKVNEAKQSDKKLSLDLFVKMQKTRALCSIADSLKIIAEAYDIPRNIPKVGDKD